MRIVFGGFVTLVLGCGGAVFEVLLVVFEIQCMGGALWSVMRLLM